MRDDLTICQQRGRISSTTMMERSKPMMGALLQKALHGNLTISVALFAAEVQRFSSSGNSKASLIAIDVLL